MRRLLIVSLLVFAAGAAFAAPNGWLYNAFDKAGMFEVYLPGGKAKGVKADLVMEAIGEQVPKAGPLACQAVAKFIHVDSRDKRGGGIMLCDGSPKVGRIYAGAYYFVGVKYDPRQSGNGEITIKDEAALQRAIGWPAK